jgi:hypothetical protein
MTHRQTDGQTLDTFTLEQRNWASSSGELKVKNELTLASQVSYMYISNVIDEVLSYDLLHCNPKIYYI